MAINSISALIPAAQPARPAVSTEYVPHTGNAGEISTLDSVVSVAPAAVTGTSAPPDPAMVANISAPSRQQVDQAMEKMRDSLPAVARNLQFSVDEATGRSVVKVVDSVTNEVIRQMPSEELLAIAKALDNFTGLLLKQKA
jgi:flagellar protein FlaG